MRWRWRIGKLLGIEFYVHATFPLLLVWVLFSSLLDGQDVPQALAGTLVMLLVFACVVAHEYGHALTARRYGIGTRDITLLPIGGIARLERMPREPGQELRIAIAGPLVNVGIAAAVFTLVRVLRGPVSLTDFETVGADLPLTLLWVNVTMFVFNLLPAFPMDGGRVLRAVLARRTDYARATRIAAGVGQAMAFLFGFLGLFYNPFLLLIALFVYAGAGAEAQAVLTQTTLQGVAVRDVMVTRFVGLEADEPLSRAVELLLTDSQQDFPVLLDGRVVGLLDRRALVAGLRTVGEAGTVRNAMRQDVAPAEADAPIEQVFQRMQASEVSTVPVTDGTRLVGLITLENITEYLMIRQALSRPRK